MVDLAEFRQHSVDEIVRESVKKHLEKSNYNHPGDLVEQLRKLGLNQSIPQEVKTQLAAMMSRRHWIAHRADRYQLEGEIPRGQTAEQAISEEQVREWVTTVSELGESILGWV